jgi:C1A family cysteine protease
MKGQTFTSLSEQQLVDCSGSEGNQGCNGGFNYKGLAYVRKNGITTTSAYPYVAKTQTCKTQGGTYKIANVPTTKGCPGVQDSIQNRPTGVSVDATNWSSYRSGVFSNCATKINHDVTLVGIVSNNWKIKNSWGASWGENGYIRLAAGNTCGICLDASPWVS